MAQFGWNATGREENEMRTITHNTPVYKIYKYRMAEAIRKCRKLKEMGKLQQLNIMDAYLRAKKTFTSSYMKMNVWKLP